MTIFDYDRSIAELINEDGEITDYEAFEALAMEREAKIENIALFRKECAYMAENIKAEIAALTARQKQMENKVKSLDNLLVYATGGEKMATSRVAVSFRKNKRCIVPDDFNIGSWMKTSVRTTTAPDKERIKAAILEGVEVPGCAVVDNITVTVK